MNVRLNSDSGDWARLDSFLYIPPIHTHPRAKVVGWNYFWKREKKREKVERGGNGHVLTENCVISRRYEVIKGGWMLEEREGKGFSLLACLTDM